VLRDGVVRAQSAELESSRKVLSDALALRYEAAERAFAAWRRRRQEDRPSAVDALGSNSKCARAVELAP